MKRLKENRGFTLIELLAVITIMGILMVVAIAGVNLIIVNSRKRVYVTDAQTFIGDAQKEITSGSLEAYDFDTAYYVHIDNLNDETIKKSPFADWKDAYVGIVHLLDGTYEYYWVSSDAAAWKIDLAQDVTLDASLVYQDDDTNINLRQPIGNRTKIVIIDKDGKRTEALPYREMTRVEASECYSFKDLSDTEIMLARYFAEREGCGTEVIIPAVIDGKKVTNINQYAFEGMGITMAYIPETVKTIGSRAFAYNDLTSVYIPASVTEIASEAFLDNDIDKLVIDEGIKTIGTRAFRKNNLTAAIVPDSVTSLGSCAYCDNPIPNPSFLYVKGDYSAIKGYIGDLSEFPDKVFRIPVFTYDESGNTVALKTIKSSAFSRMSISGWEVVIPDTVTNIESSAFWDSGIAKINIPNGVKTIGSCAFKDNKLTTIDIPSSVTSIGEYAFNSNQVPDTNPDDMWIYARNADGSINYSKLIGYAGKNRSNIQIPATKNGQPLKTIGRSTFRELNLTGTVTIPSSVTSIESLAFSQNRLTNVLNGESDTGNNGPFVYARSASGIDYSTLAAYAGGYTNMVDVPASVKTINSYAFYRAFIKGVTLPEGLKTIGSYAFSHNYINGEVVIPSTVTSIGDYSFQKVISWGDFNANLVKIVNKTNKAFNWQTITGGPSTAYFVSGTVENWYGDIVVTTA